MPFVSGEELLRKVPPCGIALKAPATEAQQKLLTDAGYRLMTEADINALGIRDLSYRENVWWQTRYPDLIPRESLFPEAGALPASRAEHTREELDLDLER